MTIHLNVDRNGVITGRIDQIPNESDLLLSLSGEGPVQPRPRSLPRLAHPHPQAQIQQALETAASLGLVREPDESSAEILCSAPRSTRTAPRSYAGWSPPEQLVDHYSAMWAEMQGPREKEDA